MLLEILKTRFGYSQFRPRQEAVCQAVADGHDALVVMPTGAGKSLCYQVPGLARGGTTLVISPLVALIEDQVTRLLSRGVKAGRIHSGRNREDSREVFRAYLRGELEFLFIAPERLAVPGFAEMLRQHPPSLIAVDEAHCISHWGHDFRPDYRLVGERLEGLKGTPVVALTATATPLVQRDICVQLRLRSPDLFIHGFRRDNLAIQVVDALPSERADRIAAVLAEPDRTPAIVYAPTRKKAEELAKALHGKIKAAAYHAGMTASDREAVQLAFLNGTTDTIVATVAFGMGIDKANVRTVVHAALPGSLESYYQEIGRGGRDGLLSKAILFHCFSDRKTHEFFMDRDQPDASVLTKIRVAVPESGSILADDLRASVKGVESDVFEKALEKLWAHGGVKIENGEYVALGIAEWRKPYEEQRKHRIAQLDSMQSFTEGGGCRMTALIRHFGDTADGTAPCGICDRCAPVNTARFVDELERGVATAILASLSGRDGQAVGRLFDEAMSYHSKVTRSGFERVLSAVSRARLVEIHNSEFEKDGKIIAFRKVFLLSAGKTVKAPALAELEIDGDPMGTAKSASRVRKKSVASRSERAPSRTSDDPSAPSEHPKLFEDLRAWRLAEARKQGVPAFRILSDRVLYAICEEMPKSEAELLAVPGMGPKLVLKYAETLLPHVRGN
jgi:RecQ family ATP-dependent DNA helicase